MNYGCKLKSQNTVGGSDPTQMELVREKCGHSNACRIEASREFFGNSECPGTDDANMSLWMVYTCKGGSDQTTRHTPNCGTGGCGVQGTGNDVEQGEMKQVDIPGCGGWVKLDCNGGCINILKVLNSYLTPIHKVESLIHKPQIRETKGPQKKL